MFEVIDCLGNKRTVFSVFADEENNIRFLVYDYKAHKWEQIYATNVYRPVDDKNDWANNF